MAQPIATIPSAEPNFEAAVLEAVEQSVVVTDLTWKIISWNRYAETLYGWSSAEALGRHIGELIVPEASTADGVAIMARLHAGLSWSGEFAVRRQDGTRFTCQSTNSPLYDTSGALVGVVGVSSDITSRKQAEAAQARLAAIVTSSENSIIAMRLDGTITDWNSGAEALYGYMAAEIVGQRIALLAAPERAEEFAGLMVRVADGETFDQFETLRLHKDGHKIDVSVSLTPIRGASDAIVGVAGIGHDISRRKQGIANLRHQALHDGLTGLPNRRLLHVQLREALEPGADTEPRRVALLMLDLDRFKEVNDTLGHQVGDVLLQQIGLRLQAAMRTTDAVARLGGDEFAVLLPAATTAAATRVARMLLGVLHAPFVLEGQPIAVDASIGVAVSPEHGQDADTLMRCADVAMYQAKRLGTGMAVYCAADDQHQPDRLALLGELRNAIDRDELLLYYQPKLDLHDGTLVGLEALVRWQHPLRGFLAPAEFIPLAEQTGLIYPLTRWVLGRALRQQQAWRGTGLDVPIAVNLSRRTLNDPQLVETVTQMLTRWEVPASGLVLEITEGSLMADPVSAGENLRLLHAMGVSISIDDFGTGYSSLGSLKNLPVDELKIDLSFVQAMATDASSRAIVRVAIDLADALKMRVVAEGVEDRATWDVLAGLGCDVAQGYFVSRPLGSTELEAWRRALNPTWLASPDEADALHERIRIRGARLIAEEEFIARKHAEAALRASEESNRLALEAAGIGTWDWDAAQDLVTWSRETEALSGVAPGTFGGTFTDYRNTINPEDWPAMEVELAAAVAERREFVSTYRPLWPDGSLHWLAGKGRGLYAADGSMVRMTGTLMDITERKQAEDALQVSEERNRLALATARMGTFDQDMLHNVLTWSPEMEVLHGLAPGSFTGTHAAFQRTVHPDDWSALALEIRAAAVEHRESHYTYRTIWPDGSVHWLEGSGRGQYTADGALARFIGTSMDVNDRKRTEAALYASQKRNRSITV